MPLSTAERDNILSQATALSSSIEALVADSDPHPLQVALDAANLALTERTAQLSAAQDANAALQGKIDAAKAAIQAANTADAAEDAARAQALQALD